MSQSEKSGYFQALKAAGVNFERHYREYTTAELKAAYDALPAELKNPPAPAAPPPLPPMPQPQVDPKPEPTVYETPPPDPEAAAFFGFSASDDPAAALNELEPEPALTAPLREADPTEMAGQRLNTKEPEEVIRVDEHGREWLQEEVRKPGYAKPRGRRVLTYLETGTEQRTVQNGKYQETFEVAGSGPGQVAQVKITLPSYQVGRYRDKRFPFTVVTYNGNEGFDLFEIQEYWGGPELVPATVKRKYVENVLCYDIRSVIQTINAEYRALQLAGKVK
jgi:hypothetical protein